MSWIDESGELQPFLCRLPPELHKGLRLAAKRRRCSMRALLVEILEKGLSGQFTSTSHNSRVLDAVRNVTK